MARNPHFNDLNFYCQMLCTYSDWQIFYICRLWYKNFKWGTMKTEGLTTEAQRHRENSRQGLTKGWVNFVMQNDSLTTRKCLGNNWKWKIESWKWKTKEQQTQSGLKKLGVWLCCSAVRIGRGFKSSLSERGRYIGTSCIWLSRMNNWKLKIENWKWKTK